MATTAEKIQNRLLFLGDYGRESSGTYWRAPFTLAETTAISEVSQWMRQAGLSVRRDAIGNLIGRIEGRDPNARTVVTGSHLDSVRNGGVFDGPLGVVAGLEAVEQLLAERGAPNCPVDVIAFTGEEGSRFPLGLLGSRAMAGLVPRDELLALRDQEDVPLGDAIQGAGLDPNALDSVARDDLACMVELHIEQGPILERAGTQVGLVEGIVGMANYQVTVFGQADHAGTTPLDMRADALLGASEMILALPEIVRPLGGVVTVGQLSVEPGSTNVVPERVTFSIDLRHRRGAELDRAMSSIRERVDTTAANRGLRLEWRRNLTTQPVLTDSALRAQVHQASDALGYSSQPIFSGAGHDSMAIASRCPVVMIFTPCRNGASHRPDEFAEVPMLEPGVAVLKETLASLAWGQSK